ncbi:MAG: GspMb/PilO family protein [FCB group bacterium]|jgi:hypothetical protein|nr:GspMb/PilO family protein [FCB group bacterium]
MNLSERDKKVVVIGGIAALAILVIGYGVIPLVKSWSGSSEALSSKAAYVNDLQERIDSQGALVKQRNALAKRMGSLFEAPGKPAPKKDGAKKDKGAQTPESPKSQTAAAVTPETPKPETVAAVTPETPKPETAAAVTPETPKPEVRAKDTAQSPESPKGEAPAVVAVVSPESPKGETKPGEKKEEAKKDEKPKAEAAGGATLAGYVEQNAKKAEATVKSITPVKTSAGYRGARYYRSVMLQVKLQCKAKGLVTLLQALEQGERFVKVEQIQIRREPKKDDMDVTLDVRAYESTGKAS